ncbi:chorismate mutase [Tropicimonas sp. IMCC6043]|uniref:chorismate mutase n=1 Tax=Tropicimonas sp. IMCC6043 TaxID=2510645 RepID=UPI00101B9BB3|nr:chorismate mutase [Tropicimonas sp. IMCC6043]RYH08928.1 chorismate mutase [Tropicimonas sp. IMCC6043]
MTRLAPEDCRSMTELRQQIDMLDAELVALLTARAGYIDRAAELKLGEGLPARIEWRVEEVVESVRGRATEIGLDPDLAEALWRRLIDWSIDREARVLGPDATSGIDRSEDA